MNATVISLAHRKPLEEVQQEETARKEEIDKSFLEAQLKILDQVREQVAAGRLQNLIIASRNPESGLFMHDMIFEPDFDKKGLAFGFAGLLEALKVELVDVAQLAPTLSSDGTLVSPHFEEGDAEYHEEGDW